MRKRKHLFKFILGVFLCVVAANVIVNSCSAGQFYPNGKSRCLSSSGRSDIYSVQWACGKAVAKSQNACATWIGPTNSSTSRVITASALTGTIPISFWGMCTDRSDVASSLMVENDGDSIADGVHNFNRSGSWGSPSSMGTTLDVAKFIKGAAIVNGMYYRRVYLGRCHSNYGTTRSCSADWSDIYLSVGALPPTPVPESPEVLCQRWAPSGWNDPPYHGITDVEVKIKNLATRFGGTGFGDWSDGTIYAMPTDEIQWTECYYGGTPGTGQTEVSSLNGGLKQYVEPLKSDMCQADEYGVSVKPFDWNGWRYDGHVGAEEYFVRYFQLYTKVSPWQNQWQTWGAGQVRRAGDSPNDARYFDLFTNKSDVKRNGYLTTLGQAGSTFTESGATGAPRSVHIYGRDPSISIDKSYYETTEIDWGSPKTCAVDTIFGPIYITSGDYCGYETYQLPHYDGHSCTNRYEDTIYDAYVEFGNDTDSASVQIPYNFTTYTGVELADGEVFAGETVRVSKVWTQVASKSNAVTQATYATQAPGSRLKLYAYVTSDEYGGIEGDSTGTNDNICSMLGGRAKQCREYGSKSGLTLNGGGSLEGSYETWSDLQGQYDAFDASAGDYLCFTSLVYPASSGSDTQMGTGGDGLWRYSEPTCTLIAKRPTFQVWGADMYSNSSINAVTSTKRNIFHAYNNLGQTFTIRNGYGKNTFGSWVEEGLMLGRSASTSNLASGAAMGNNGDAKKAYAGNMGDFRSSLSPLTIANYSGSSYNIGSSGLTLNMSDTDRKKAIDYWVHSTQNTASGARIEYYNNSTIGGMTVPLKYTRIYEVNGTATITGNIVYAGHDSSSYTTLRDIPKVIIYANNVNIQCGVTRVDAIIITKSGGTVNTCSNAGSSNDDPARANPLKVFGMVITDGITLGRTYGQAAWKGSGANGQQAAAEVFDFDSSILLWSEFMASAAETDTMQIVYQNEIAPRY